ncbi:bifunctional 2-polyprenyl-6-hydroxyphenol methylase/3-demethylubiquinol 3-O-methyltransferase UbiG [Amycolatopsis sp. WQ 127309]|uniref:class I SAM-dependent methyltransferase n=1 Tax=Amycolatopsis sp. WQ 127309 TaxID=2932773 RepID=UPI001FF43206|nr:class I SAM-dependent methyltransferase [Amycolatopsis sp. WQ 127309]UOZ02744.1 class I SAM-dependent methyltransferase [Amycolatopsis sp. WQ 127309]
MAYSATASVYEHFPFPSSNVDNSDVLVPDDIPAIVEGGLKSGWTVLDAGCGTGQTVVSMARAYPDVDFVGLEPNGPSREVAERLRSRAGVTNLKLVDGSISGEPLGTEFDFIYSYGVVHHIPDPAEAIRWLSAHLAENALLHLWIYGSIGEAERMRQREMVQLLNRFEGKEGIRIVRALGLQLSPASYGIAGDYREVAESSDYQDILDADAFLNPVVQTMRVKDVAAVLGQLADWVAMDRVWASRGNPHIDLSGAEADGSSKLSVLTPEDLFEAPLLRESIAALSPLERSSLIELAVSASGFNLLAGRGTALSWCTPRIGGNLLT